MGYVKIMGCVNLRDCLDITVSYCPTGNSSCLTPKGIHRVVVCKEKKKEYRLLNNGSNIAKYHVDGGVINSTTVQKCDFMVVGYTTQSNKIIFIELKGTDILHAYDQIKNTIIKLAPNLRRLENRTCYARVVGKSIPNISATSANRKNLIEELRKLSDNNIPIADMLKSGSTKLEDNLNNM